MQKGNKPLIKETQNTKPKETYSCLFHTPSPGAEQHRRRESSLGTTLSVQLHIPVAVSLQAAAHGAGPLVSSISSHTHTQETQELCSPELNHTTLLLWTKSNSPKIANFPTAQCLCYMPCSHRAITSTTWE